MQVPAPATKLCGGVAGTHGAIGSVHASCALPSRRRPLVEAGGRCPCRPAGRRNRSGAMTDRISGPAEVRASEQILNHNSMNQSTNSRALLGVIRARERLSGLGSLSPPGRGSTKSRPGPCCAGPFLASTSFPFPFPGPPHSQASYRAYVGSLRRRRRRRAGSSGGGGGNQKKREAPPRLPAAEASCTGRTSGRRASA